MPAYPKLKLVYFNAAGRAESVRLALAIGDVPFEDERISHAEFSARKASLPYGQTPVLEVDGQVLAQSQAILRYAGRLANLYPANDAVAALKVDEILSVFDELQDKMGPSFREPDPEKKKVLREELATSILPRYLMCIEARLVKMKQYPVFQAKDDVFIHEIVIFACVRILQNGVLDHVPTNVTDGYAEINAAATKIREHQKVKAWYANPRNVVPKLKLTYFEVAGRGSPIRLALHIGGIEFEDERITRAEYAIRRDAESLPFGQLPLLEINGDVMAQSLAILRYVGSLTGLYPVNEPLPALRIDEMLCLIDEFYMTLYPTHRMEPEAQIAARQALLEGSFGSQLTAADKRVASWGAQYAVSDELTVADLAIHGVILSLKSGRFSGIPTTWVDGFPHLVRIYNQVNESAKVQEYRQTKEF